MAIPTVMHDLGLLYLVVAIMILCYFFSWVWRMLSAKWPVDTNWLAMNDPQNVTHYDQELFRPRSKKLGPSVVTNSAVRLLDDDALHFELIPGDMCPGKAEKCAKEMYTHWRTNEFRDKILADFEPAPLPEFLRKNFADKNHGETHRAISDIYGHHN